MLKSSETSGQFKTEVFELQLRSLTVEVNDCPLFHPITLDLSQGSLVLLHGANGSGKSTFLKALAGLLPYTGQCYWQGKECRDLDVRFDWMDQTAYLGQALGLKKKLSTAENIYWDWSWSNSEPQKKIFFEYSHPSMLQLTAHLSAGQRMLLALKRLVAQEKKLWLLDEPQAHLDEQHQQWLFSTVQEHVQSGGIVIVSSHFVESWHWTHTVKINRYATQT